MSAIVSSGVLCLCFVFCMWTSRTVANSTASNIADQPVAGYGYEMLSAKLDFIQYKLLEMELVMKERIEEVAEKQIDLEKVLSSLLGSVNRLDQEIGNNLTVLQTDSWKIIAQQSACASHELMRKEISQLVSKEGVSKKAQSLLALHGLWQKDWPFQSCKDVPAKESGVYSITVGDKGEQLKAFCEQSSFGGGWLVIQYRYDGSLEFYRNWTEYQNGFGNVYQEFWIGLEKIHQLTSRRQHELMVEVKDFNGNYSYAHYTHFEIGSETEQYALKELGGYDGTASDALSYNKGMKFSTMDNENNDTNCAQEKQAGWWHNYCSSANLNGRYLNEDAKIAISWNEAAFAYHGLAYSRMMVREVEK